MEELLNDIRALRNKMLKDAENESDLHTRAAIKFHAIELMNIYLIHRQKFDLAKIQPFESDYSQ